jgi:hypothetical protein
LSHTRILIPFRIRRHDLIKRAKRAKLALTLTLIVFFLFFPFIIPFVTIRAFVSATMPTSPFSILTTTKKVGRRTYCAKLSDLENALLQCGQIYGLSCV